MFPAAPGADLTRFDHRSGQHVTRRQVVFFFRSRSVGLVSGLKVCPMIHCAITSPCCKTEVGRATGNGSRRSKERARQATTPPEGQRSIGLESKVRTTYSLRKAGRFNPNSGS